MNTESEINIYLQKQHRSFTEGGPARDLRVTFGTGYYGDRSTAMIEVEGSPIKGLALIVASAELGDVEPWDCEVWVLQPRNRMRHLPAFSHEAISIAEWVITRSREGGY